MDMKTTNYVRIQDKKNLYKYKKMFFLDELLDMHKKESELNDKLDNLLKEYEDVLNIFLESNNLKKENIFSRVKIEKKNSETIITIHSKSEIDNFLEKVKKRNNNIDILKEKL